MLTALAALLTAAVGVLTYFDQRPHGNGTPSPSVQHSHVIADVSLRQRQGVSDWDNDGVSCVPQGDGYHVIMNAICAAPPYGVESLSTYTVAVNADEVGPANSNFYGLASHFSSAGRYEFLISSDGYAAIGIYNPGQKRRWLLPPEVDSFINRGAGTVNRLEVRITGTHMAFLINGAVVAQAEDNTFTGGTAALVSLNRERVFTSEKSTDAQRRTGDIVFTDFKITAPLS